MKLFEEFGLYESMWDNTVGKNSAAIQTARSRVKASMKHTRKRINEAVSSEYDKKEVRACLNRVADAARTIAPDFDEVYGDGMVYVSVSEELLKKALRIGNRGTFQDGSARAVTVPAQAVDDMALCLSFYEDGEGALLSLMLGGEDEDYYDDICVVGWGDHVVGLSSIKDIKSAKTFFETRVVPNANKIAEDIINNSWAHYQLSDYAGITTYTEAVTESNTGTSWDNLVAQADNFLDAIIKATGNENYDDGDGYWEAEGTTWCNRYLYYSNNLNNTGLVKDLCGIGSTKIPGAKFYYTEDDMEDDPVSEIGYTLNKTAPVTHSGPKQNSRAEAQAAKYRVLYFDGHTEIVDEDTMNHLVDELEAFTRDDVSQIHRISGNEKLGKTIWTEEEGLL